MPPPAEEIPNARVFRDGLVTLARTYGGIADDEPVKVYLGTGAGPGERVELTADAIDGANTLRLPLLEGASVEYNRIARTFKFIGRPNAPKMEDITRIIGPRGLPPWSARLAYLFRPKTANPRPAILYPQTRMERSKARQRPMMRLWRWGLRAAGGAVALALGLITIRGGIAAIADGLRWLGIEL